MPDKNEAPAPIPAPDAETRRLLLRSAVRAANEALACLELASPTNPCPHAAALRDWAGRLWLDAVADEQPETRDLAPAELFLELAARDMAALYGTERGAGVTPLPALARLRQMQGREAEARALEERFTLAVANDERERQPPAPEVQSPSEN